MKAKTQSEQVTTKSNKFSLKKAAALVSIVAVMMCALVLGGCGSNTEQKAQTNEAPTAQTKAEGSGGLKLVKDGTLITASNYQFPPFEYLDNNVPAGFSIEFMDLLAKQAGLKCEWADPIKFDALLPLVEQGGKIDVACASITITPEREKQVNFTDPYLDSNQGVAVNKDSGITDVQALNKAGVKIGIQSGSTGEAWAKENLPNAEFVAYDDVVAAFNALQAKKADAVISDLPVQQWMVKNSFPTVDIIKEIPTGEQYGIAVSKDNPELLSKLNKALAEIKTNGSYDKLIEKYFGTSESAKK